VVFKKKFDADFTRPTPFFSHVVDFDAIFVQMPKREFRKLDTTIHVKQHSQYDGDVRQYRPPVVFNPKNNNTSCFGNLFWSLVYSYFKQQIIIQWKHSDGTIQDHLCFVSRITAKETRRQCTALVCFDVQYTDSGERRTHTWNLNWKK
jgi:hypothetical protein